MAVEIRHDVRLQRRYEFTTSSGSVSVAIPEILEDGEVYEIRKFLELVIESCRRRERPELIPAPPPCVDPAPEAPPERHEDLIGEF